MHLRKKLFLLYVIVLQCEQKLLKVYLLTSQHSTMCQELLCNEDEFGSTYKIP
jgi:hypothetical protein